MECWHERMQDGGSFDLYITGEDQSQLIERISTRKPVVIQRRGKVWHGYGYFAEFSRPKTWAELQVKPVSRKAQAIASTASTFTIPTTGNAVEKSAVTVNRSRESDAEAQSTSPSLTIITMDDLVPSGKWISTPGSGTSEILGTFITVSDPW